MRHIYCVTCGTKYRDGTYELFARSLEGEPAENARVVAGVARKPLAAQRRMSVNDVSYPLDGGHYNCDMCGAEILPGRIAKCVTVWNENQQEPPEWESAFIEAI